VTKHRYRPAQAGTARIGSGWMPLSTGCPIPIRRLPGDPHPRLQGHL